MIIIEKAQDCSTITIKSQHLYNWIQPGTTVTSITLSFVYNTSGSSTLSFVTGDVTTEVIGGNNYGVLTLESADFGQAESVISDGVYCFTLTTVDNTVTYTENAATFIDCTMKCTLAEKLWNEPELLIYAKHEAISKYLECNPCDCSLAYKLYNDLLCDLGLSTLPCGC